MDDDSEARDRRESDLPVDLSRERESFVRQFLKQGVEFTESLLEENKELHAQLAELREQNTLLRSQVASDDAIRDLLRKIESLENERCELLERSTRLEETSKENQDRNVEVEQELHDLANLYIASSHLHSTLSVRGVMRHLCELLQQLVGAELFAIYLLRGERAVPIGADGTELASLEPIVRGEGMLGEVMMTGMPRIAPNPQPGGTIASPIAAIPLMVRDSAVGAISIATVFAQKPSWAAVDRELFKLIGAHAATALIAANLYADEPGPTTALDGLTEHLRSN